MVITHCGCYGFWLSNWVTPIPPYHQVQISWSSSLDSWSELITRHFLHNKHTCKQHILPFCGTHHLTYIMTGWLPGGDHITAGHNRPWGLMPEWRREKQNYTSNTVSTNKGVKSINLDFFLIIIGDWNTVTGAGEAQTMVGNFRLEYRNTEFHIGKKRHRLLLIQYLTTP